MAQFSRFNDLDNVSRTASSIAALVDIKRSKQGLIDRHGNYTQQKTGTFYQNITSANSIRLPGNLMGIKVPQLGVDSKAVTYKAEQMRDQRGENNESIETVLQNYFKQSSVYL